ncbi:4-hydroxy-2-oxovalerate aldolase [Conexibacter stalactiti]|uniref:4-hydroxy-2-oxovalerate aldolase n=1 Tax=Conexibacter stalactiti TaxID=1940611 RepID=A0ABU4HPR6_9ACTN|nr:4-hydroxy-2-oxovalerate aldolase [Conexibacter stalactiti]MDW5594049.1 4-hydroxy-2-oxovalerate aldolase [Conexibacter stalactiti]MEC5034691.1 4-hydroxy-2-oxovalerate aldolase [Conexibacter stalactiti]
MSAETLSVTVCDATLRDGSHAVAHQFTAEQVRAVVGGLDDAGVPVIEVSHGDGLGGSSLTYGRSGSDELELIEAAVQTAERARIAVLLLPGIGTKDDLRAARERGAQVVRVATHCTEADISPQHIALAGELGYTPIGFLMMAHMNSPEGLAEQAAIMAAAGAEAVYVTDSAGALVPDGVSARVAALRERLGDEVAIGFHGHQNMELGVANSIAAVRAGARWVDTCTCGLGAGAGNTPTGAFVAAAERSGIATGIDLFEALEVAETTVRPLMRRPQIADRGALLLGYAGVYSSFLLHAERAAERFGVPVEEILLECGRRKTVGGQEDWIIEIAAELASRSEVVA